MSGAEINGIVAASEQFAEVLFKTIKLVKSVIDEIQDAPNKIHQQVGRLESLTSLAKQIQNTKTLQTEEISTILTRCKSIVQSLQGLLQKVSFENHDSIRRKTWRALFSLKEEENILKLFDVLDQEYNSINTHINLRILGMTEDTQTRYQNIDTKLNTIAQLTDSSPDSLKCLQGLFITDPDMDRAKLITAKGELVYGTCDWIPQNKEFMEWRASEGGLLWISGGPGLGKTMLSIYLTEYLSSCFRAHGNEKSHYSTYFFCDAKESTRNNAVAILRGLIFQLVQQKKELIQHILPTYQIQKDRLFDQTSFEALWKYFLDMVNSLGNSQVTCIIDGLDECDSKSLEPLLIKLSKMTSMSPRLKMIVLSREYPQCLGEYLGEFSRIRLDPDAKTEIGDGLDLYISTRAAELSKRKNYPPDLTNDVKNILREKSTGTYLWVSFAVKDLQEIGRSEVKKSLEQFPRGLDALYERILNQIKPARQDLTLNILRWCAFADRPLKLDELVAALNIKPVESLDERTVLEEKIAACGHFLNITDDKVTLVHQSAYDFLTAPFSKSESIPWFSLCRVEAEHSKLASTCIAYFHDAYFNNEDIEFLHSIDETTPFFSYATYLWADHFSRSGEQGVKVLDEYPKFFSNKSEVWKAWVRMRFNGSYRPERIAVELGLTALMQRIIKKRGTWLYLKDTFGKSEPLLLLAIRKGHLPIAEILIDNNMNTNARDEWGSTALHQAARKGHLSIVEMLIKNNADIHSTDGWGATALHEAAEGVHLPIVKMLIKNGAHFDSGRRRETPLCLAAEWSHLEVAEYLLTCGASINGTDPEFSPLAKAISSRNPELVKLLLERGADDRIHDGSGLTVVGKELWNQPATLMPFLEVWAQSACTAPSQFREKVDFGKTSALHLACLSAWRLLSKLKRSPDFDLSAMHFLLDPKWSLDLNWRDEDGNTPLHLAAEEGHLDAVDLLLTQPSVDPRLVNKWGLSSLQMAFLHHRTAVARRMLKEPNISLPEDDENCTWSAIHLVIRRDDSTYWTAKREFRKMLRFLIIEIGVDPQSRTPKAENLDDEWHSHHFLNPLDSLGSITPPDSCYETPLSIAIQRGCRPAVEYLLAHCNIDPNAPCRGCDGASPLHVAAQSLNMGLVEILITWKANVSSLDKYQRTPLHSVASGISSPYNDYSQKQNIQIENIIIKLLLTAGAQTSTKDINGRTPRDLFASGRHFRETRHILGIERMFDKPFWITEDFLNWAKAFRSGEKSTSNEGPYLVIESDP